MFQIARNQAKVVVLPLIKTVFQQILHKSHKLKPSQIRQVKETKFRHKFGYIFLDNFRLRKKMRLLLEHRGQGELSLHMKEYMQLRMHRAREVAARYTASIR